MSYVYVLLTVYHIVFCVQMLQINNIKKSLKPVHQDEEHMIVDSKVN